MTKDYNDYELIDVVSDGSDDTLELIINKYQPVIKYIANKKLKIASNLGLDFSDLYQEGMIGLVEAIRDFRDNKGVTFYTFANLCINRQINTALTRNNRFRDQALNSSLSLDKKISDSNKTLLDFVEPITNITPLNEIIEEESNLELYSKIKNKLSKLENEIFDLRIKNYGYDEIQKKLNITVDQLYSAMRRIKNKIKSILEV